MFLYPLRQTTNIRGPEGASLVAFGVRLWIFRFRNINGRALYTLRGILEEVV